MTRELVLVHGRAQQGKDSVALKAEWIESLRAGLAASGLDLPVPESAIRFPYYGDTLEDLVAGRSGDAVADVVVRGTGDDEAAQAFLEEVVLEVQEGRGLPPDAVHEAAGSQEVLGRGFQNSRLVLGILRALDRHVPHASGPALALATSDVYHYLHNPGIGRAIAEGVRAAMTPGAESVVVGHSLGSVVAYRLLKEEGPAAGWRVPHLITLGCPLGVGAIRRRLAPVGHPSVAGAWFNAFDPHDVVALRPLRDPWFGIDPAVTNKDDVLNETPNQHGISGYLEDAEVARRIHDALVGD